MKQPLVFILIFSVALLTSSCDITRSRYRTPGDQATALLQAGIQSDESILQMQKSAQLPPSVKKALIPGLENAETGTNDSTYSAMYGKRFNINVNNISADLFFKNLAKETPYSIVVDPQVSGNITLKLKDVSITQILDALRDTYGFNYRQTSYGFQVLPARLETQTFHVNYLDIMRKSSSYTQISADELINVLPSTTSGDISNNSSSSSSGGGGSGGGSGSGTTPTAPGASRSQVNTSAQLDFWKDLTSSLTALVGSDNGRSVIVNPGSGTIVVKGYPNDIRQVGDFLDKIQSNMSEEVVLEVKLLEVQLNDSFSSGIDWSVFGFTQIDNSATLSNATPLTTINIHGNNFESVISLLEQQGNVQTLANPRVLTINNQQAVIRIGNDQFYVTGITTNVNNNGSVNTVTTASVALTPFFSGVILDITPQISRNGEVLLHLHPVVSNVSQIDQKIDIGATKPMVLPLADNNIREYDSIVRAQNQQVVMVGGLTQNTLNETVQGTPGASKIPFLGTLFRSTSQKSSKVELVILLKPTIIGRGRNMMSQQLPMAEERINQLDRGYHFGSLPELFGSEAENPEYNRPVDH